MKKIPYSGSYFFHFYFNYIWNLVVKFICLPHNLIVDRKHKICSQTRPFTLSCADFSWPFYHLLLLWKSKELETVTWENSVQMCAVENKIGVWYHLLFHITILSPKNVKLEAVFWLACSLTMDPMSPWKWVKIKRAADKNALHHSCMPMPGKDMEGHGHHTAT